MSAPSPKWSGHAPDWPFGCGTDWGPYIQLSAGGGLHICNLKSNHSGNHVCKCGEERLR